MTADANIAMAQAEAENAQGELERNQQLMKKNVGSDKELQEILSRRDLESALAQGPLGWVRGRIHVELGKAADLDGRAHHVEPGRLAHPAEGDQRQDHDERDGEDAS